MSGLFTAAFLRQIGWDVDVFERSPVELVGRGAGITTHPELLEALEKSGAGTRDLGIEVEKRITIDRQGRVIGERPLRQILTSWDRLQRLLRETIDPAHYHLGHTFARVEQDGRRGPRAFRRGPGRARRPAGRRRRHPVRRARAGRAGGAADLFRLLHLARRAERGRPRAGDAREHLSLLRLLPARAPAGHRLSDLRASTTTCGWATAATISSGTGSATPGTAQGMCVDENGDQHDYSVPPPLIRKDLIAQMRAEAETIMPPAFVDCLRNIERPFFTPIYDFSTPRIVFGRVALVGDAGSSARPHMGFGVAKAGGDAQALADALAAHDDIDAALAAYNARAPADRRAHHAARPQARHPSGRRPQDRRGPQDVEAAAGYDAMMDWIAVPNFLAAYR